MLNDPEVHADPEAEARRIRLEAREAAREDRRRRLVEQEAAEAAVAEAELKADGEPRRGILRDAELGIIRGSVKAISNAAALAQAAADWLDENFIDLRLSRFGIGSPEDPGALEVLSVGLREHLEHNVPETERLSGGVAEPISQFIAGFLLTRRAGQAARAREYGRNAQVGVAMGRGAVADFVAFHEHEERASNLVQSVPALQNPVTEFLAADENDSMALGRFKMALEGALLGGVAEGVMRVAPRVIDSVADGFRAIKAMRRARQLRKIEEAEAANPRLRDDPAPAADAAPTGRQKPEAAPHVSREARPDPAATTVNPVDDITTSFRRSVDELRANPEKLKELQARIARGDLSDVDDLIPFNMEKVDLNELARLAGEDSGEGLRRLINTVAEGLEPLIDNAARSWADTEAVATAIFRNTARRSGGTMDEVANFFGGVTSNGGLAARYIAAERVKYAVAAAVRREAREGLSSAASELRSLELLHLYGVLQAMVRGSKSEIARALNIMKSGRQFSGLSEKALQESLDATTSPVLRQALLKRLASAKNIDDIGGLANRSVSRGLVDVALATYIQGLLSAGSTFMLNTFSNTFKVFDEFVVRALAVPIGAARHGVLKATNKNFVPYERETMQSFVAMLQGSLEGLKYALYAPVGQMARALAQGKGWDGVRLAARQSSEAGTMGTSWTAFRNKHTHYGNPHESIEAMRSLTAQNHPWERKLINALTAGELPVRGIVWGDDLHKSIAYHQSIKSSAWRRAMHEADAAGRSNDARWIERRADTLAKAPEADMVAQAHRDANYSTFQTPVSLPFFKSYERMLQENPALRLVTPFYRTPAQLVRQGVERTPYGVMKGLSQASHEGDKMLARGLAGSLVMMGVYSEYLEGRITGSRRTSLTSRNSSELDGAPAYARKFGDRWIQYVRAEPMGLIMSVTADYLELTEHWQNTPEEREFLSQLADLSASIIRQFNEKTWFQGITDVLTAATVGSGRVLERYVTGKAVDLATPYQSFFRRLSLRDQEFMQEAQTVHEQLWSTYGFIYERMGRDDPRVDRRDYLGRPIPRTDYLGGPLISPVIASYERDDVLSQELAAIGFNYTMPSRTMDGIRLNGAQYNRYLQLRGEEKYDGASLQDVLTDLVTSDSWQDRTPYEREEMVKTTVSDFGRLAKQRLMEEDPELADRIRYSQLFPVFKDRDPATWPEEFRRLHRGYYERNPNRRDPFEGQYDGPAPTQKVEEDLEAVSHIRRRSDPGDWSRLIRGA